MDTPESLDNTVNRTSPIPLYEQIRRQLLSMVLSWPAENERFHTDQELSEIFGVSRMTVRQAVQELVNSGFLRRVRGSGTFVCTGKVEERMSLESSFIDQWADSGQHLEFEVLRCEAEPCPGHVYRQLNISKDDLVWSIVRRRKVGDIPISVDYRYIPSKLVKEIRADQVESNSLLFLVSKDVALDYGDLTVEAELADAEKAEVLSLMPGDPLLKRSLHYYTEEKEIALYGVSYYHAGQVRYSFRVELGDDESSVGVRGKNRLEYKHQLL